MYITRDRETGTMIDEFATKETAEKAVAEYEKEDKIQGTYVSDFYEVASIK